MSASTTPDTSPAPQVGAVRRLPPVAEVAVTSICLMLVGGVYLAAQLPGHPGLVLPVALVVAGGALTVGDMVALSRVRPFAWGTFFLVIKWALLAYLVIAGLLEYVFIKDGTPGATMAVLSATLVVFAVDVPTILAFTVARFADPGSVSGSVGDAGTPPG